ncbi:MAG: response regulator transcription factor [Flammeovirgaceae bacterium]|nr:response regulator transcription factor [Flammeovirgaceae bacterium]
MIRNKLKIYLADDHTVVRKGMIRLLSTFDRVSEIRDASNGKELIAQIEKSEPDAVIMDVEMPVMGGVDAAKYIAQHYPEVKILILTMHTEEVFIHKLMDIGIHGFLSKAAEPSEVELALYSIIDRDFYRNEIVERALKKISAQVEENHYVRLTTRELEILLLICQEYTPGEISERLQISEKTFFNHRSNILEKAEVRSNVGLLRFALQRGYFAFAVA